MKNNIKFEKVVYKIIEKYQKILLLDKHTILLKYSTENRKAIMECIFNYPYLNVTLKYGDKALEMWKDKENIVPFVIHELCHPITDPLYSKATDRHATQNEINDEREKLTDYICNIVFKNKL